MKKLTILFILAFIIQVTGSPQGCLTEGVVFTTQAQIDNFQSNYPNCTEIEGNVKIKGQDIINLNGLQALSSIGGWLVIVSSDALTSLEGLENLSIIGGNLDIIGNDSLTTLSGLNNLTAIGGYLEIMSNPSLTSLTGLNNLAAINGFLAIKKNASLTDLTDLNNLVTINGSLAIIQNNSLADLSGLDNIEAASITELNISFNPVLSTCNVQSVCEYLAAPNGKLTITMNDYGCNDLYDLRYQCGIDSIQSCLPDGIHFKSQFMIDNFPANYPNCSEIRGDVEIGCNGCNITNLNGLSVLTSIWGELSIWHNNDLTSLSGLDNLTSIGGTLDVWNNDSLINLTGLDSLTSIGGGLFVSKNNALLNLTGLEKVTAIEGGVTVGFWSDWGIYGNPSLTSLTGLDNLASIGGALAISYNDSLKSLTGLGSLSSIGGDLSISGNDTLTSMTGLEELNSIGGDLSISSYYGLLSLNGLEGLNTVGGSLYIGHGRYGNLRLSNITGLANLTSIGGDLFINYNAALTSLRGLEELNNIGGAIGIGFNDALTSLNGLDSIDDASIESIAIYNNTALFECEVQSICSYLASPNGTIVIHDNAPGCNSQQEVLDSCDFSSINNSATSQITLIHPNPFSNSTTIEYEFYQPSHIQITIYNHLGKQVEVIEQHQSQGKQQFVWDAEGLPAGVYFCVVKTESGTQTMKLIKLK